MRNENAHGRTHTLHGVGCGPDEGRLSVLTLMATAKHTNHTATTNADPGGISL